MKLVFASAFALVAGYSVYASQKIEMSDLAMANVEALASGESSTCTFSYVEKNQATKYIKLLRKRFSVLFDVINYLERCVIPCLGNLFKGYDTPFN